MIDRLSECAIQGQDICCDIVSSLEFKEVTKSKINESIKVVNSLEEKLAYFGCFQALQGHGLNFQLFH